MSESTGINQSSPKISRLSSQNSLLDWIGSFGSEDIGVDIGTSNIVLFMKHKGLVFPEASVIARNRMSGEYLAYGTRAEEMEGKTPSEIVISRPMKESAIVDYNGTAFLLNSIVNKSYLKGMFSIRGSLCACLKESTACRGGLFWKRQWPWAQEKQYLSTSPWRL